MGCSNERLQPGIALIFSFIFSAKSSLLNAVVHCFLSFSTIIISALSIGIGSVGISLVPIFVTTSLTSGNVSANFSNCVPTSIL